MNSELLDNVDVFYGETSEALARIYARADLADIPADLQLAGRISGPQCRYAKTLQTKVRLVDRGPGPTRLAEAILPDPCSWTPALPHVYSVELELVRGEREVVAHQRRLFGIRRLGVKGPKFVWDGQPWEFKAMPCVAPTEADLAAARDNGYALVVQQLDELLADEASRLGVLLVLRATGDAAEIARQLGRAARWPAVGAAFIAQDAFRQSQGNFRSRAPNLLLLDAARYQRMAPGELLHFGPETAR